MTHQEDTEANWRALAESVPDQIFRLDRSGVIQFVNRVVPPLTREQVIGTDWLAWVPDDQRTRIERELSLMLSEGLPRSYFLEAVGPDGATAMYQSHIGPMVESGRVVGAVLLARDVTLQRRMENQAITSDRLTSVGVLAGGIAHEINNPLACVVANLELLGEMALGRETLTTNLGVVQMIADAREAATRVRAVVKDLMALARDADRKDGPVDLEGTLEAALRICASEIRYRAKLESHYETGLYVRGNESRIGHALMNLILHTAHAIPEGSAHGHELSIATRKHDAVFAAVEIGSTATNGEARDVATPFFPGNVDAPESALGISISRNIVAALGGEIHWQKNADRGSLFTVLLPLAHDVVALPIAPEPVGATKSGRVLVIDDEPLIGSTIQRSLKRKHHVTVSMRADEVLVRIRDGEQFDVIVCDLMMPHMTGMEFHAGVVAFAPALAERIIFLTGGAFTAAASEFLENVPNRRLTKPFEVKALIEAVEERMKAK